ncbi:barstar family protein [Niabella ginsengisoli]|uniref:Barstar family protein n=1 Tax=Niabella ginsengisoli TaxID=522298 RepID=A0ABS9SF52_9BACT|nr:barstar family protein [Niabella ginsengisoli]MCH5596975.1 barstar family protein [Niabella ginsengisoli]
MNKAIFDFERIGTMDDFYIVAKRQLNLPEHFGKNLDALWDSLTGDIELPLAVRFENMSMSQLEIFDKLIQLFEEASGELGEAFSFEYYLRKAV